MRTNNLKFNDFSKFPEEYFIEFKKKYCYLLNDIEKYILWKEGIYTGTTNLGKNYKSTIKKRDRNKCVMCGSQEKITVDHIIPKSVKQDNSEFNLATLCFDCNQEKSNRIIHGFIEKFLL